MPETWPQAVLTRRRVEIRSEMLYARSCRYELWNHTSDHIFILRIILAINTFESDCRVDLRPAKLMCNTRHYWGAAITWLLEFLICTKSLHLFQISHYQILTAFARPRWIFTLLDVLLSPDQVVTAHFKEYYCGQSISIPRHKHLLLQPTTIV